MRKFCLILLIFWSVLIQAETLADVTSGRRYLKWNIPALRDHITANISPKHVNKFWMEFQEICYSLGQADELFCLMHPDYKTGVKRYTRSQAVQVTPPWSVTLLFLVRSPDINRDFKRLSKGSQKHWKKCLEVLDDKIGLMQSRFALRSAKEQYGRKYTRLAYLQAILKRRYSFMVLRGAEKLADATYNRDIMSHQLVRRLIYKYSVSALERELCTFMDQYGAEYYHKDQKTLQKVLGKKLFTTPLNSLIKKEIEKQNLEEVALRKLHLAAKNTKELWQKGYIRTRNKYGKIVIIKLAKPITESKRFAEMRNYINLTCEYIQNINSCHSTLGVTLGISLYENDLVGVSLIGFAGLGMNVQGAQVQGRVGVNVTIKLTKYAERLWERIERFNLVFSYIGGGFDVSIRMSNAYALSLNIIFSWVHGIPFGEIGYSKRTLQNLMLDIENKLRVLKNYNVLVQEKDLAKTFPRNELQVEMTKRLWRKHVGGRSKLDEQVVRSIRSNLYSRVLEDVIIHYMSKQAREDLEEYFKACEKIAKKGLKGAFHGIGVSWQPPLPGVTPAWGIGIGPSFKVTDKVKYYSAQSSNEFKLALDDNKYFASRAQLTQCLPGDPEEVYTDTELYDLSFDRDLRYYKVFELKRDVSFKEIQSKYKSVTSAKTSFMQKAYSILSNKEKRARYDMSGFIKTWKDKKGVNWFHFLRDGTFEISVVDVEDIVYVYKKHKMKNFRGLIGETYFDIGEASITPGGSRWKTKNVYTIIADNSPKKRGQFYAYRQVLPWGNVSIAPERYFRKGTLIIQAKGGKVRKIWITRKCKDGSWKTYELRRKGWYDITYRLDITRHFRYLDDKKFKDHRNKDSVIRFPIYSVDDQIPISKRTFQKGKLKDVFNHINKHFSVLWKLKLVRIINFIRVGIGFSYIPSKIYSGSLPKQEEKKQEEPGGEPGGNGGISGTPDGNGGIGNNENSPMIRSLGQ